MFPRNIQPFCAVGMHAYYIHLDAVLHPEIGFPEVSESQRERERERERGGRVKRRPRAYGPKALYEPNRAGHSVRV